MLGVARVRGWCALVLVALLVLAACGGGSEPGSPGSSAPSSSGSGATSSSPGTADPRPNIVLIMTDDMSAAELKYLPRTERLLTDQGVDFTDFAAPQPLCCPARAQMLTGQYAQNNGVKTNQGPEGGYAQFHPDTAMPVSLHDAGYQTAMIGKYLNGYPARHPPEVGWDHWDPTIHRIYYYYGYTQYADGRYLRPAAYHTDYVARASEQVIGDMAAQHRPFFLWASFVAPHSRCRLRDEISNCTNPPRPGPRDRYRFRGMQGLTDSLPSFNEADVSDKPPVIRRRPLQNVHHLDVLQDRRAGALDDVDRAVQGIVDELRATGQLDHTLIVFTSDNGYLMGQHRYEGKVLGYEESVKVPLLMRGLGLPAGVVDRRSYAMIDLAPTFEALAGATPLVDVDGEPIVVRQGLGARPPDRTLLLQAGVTNLTRFPTGWWFRGARTRRYTYIAWTNGFRELYDRHVDPYELRNVAGQARYAQVQATMARRTELLGSCAGASCRTAFPAMPEPLTPRQVRRHDAREHREHREPREHRRRSR